VIIRARLESVLFAVSGVSIALKPVTFAAFSSSASLYCSASQA
jgi:hypothetical protein